LVIRLWTIFLANTCPSLGLPLSQSLDSQKVLSYYHRDQDAAFLIHYTFHTFVSVFNLKYIISILAPCNVASGDKSVPLFKIDFLTIHQHRLYSASLWLARVVDELHTTNLRIASLESWKFRDAILQRLPNFLSCTSHHNDGIFEWKTIHHVTQSKLSTRI